MASTSAERAARIIGPAVSVVSSADARLRKSGRASNWRTGMFCRWPASTTERSIGDACERRARALPIAPMPAPSAPPATPPIAALAALPCAPSPYPKPPTAPMPAPCRAIPASELTAAGATRSALPPPRNSATVPAIGWASRACRRFSRSMSRSRRYASSASPPVNIDDKAPPMPAASSENPSVTPCLARSNKPCAPEGLWKRGSRLVWIGLPSEPPLGSLGVVSVTDPVRPSSCSRSPSPPSFRRSRYAAACAGSRRSNIVIYACRASFTLRRNCSSLWFGFRFAMVDFKRSSSRSVTAPSAPPVGLLSRICWSALNAELASIVWRSAARS